MGLFSLIGLDSIKERANISIRSCIIRGEPFPHTLLLGSGGLGKSKVAKSVAEDIDAYYDEVEAAVFKNRKQFVERIVSADNTAKCYNKNLILFIDEIHRLSLELQEVLYYPMKEKRICTKSGVFHNLQPTTIIGATTREDMLDQKSFIQRFVHIWKLEPYSQENIELLLFKQCLDNHLECNNNDLKLISKRSMGNPRIAIRYFELIRDETIVSESQIITKEHIKTVFNREEVSEEGLTKEQTQYIMLLKGYDSPRGLNWIASALQSVPNIVEEVIEPSLIQMGLVDRSSSGRMLTEKGRKIK